MKHTKEKVTENHFEATDALPRHKRLIKEDETFCFSCGPDLECFTACCTDVNIVLLPVDVLSLSRKLGLGTQDFLEKHTLLPVSKGLHLPVVMLRMGEEPARRCPFVTDQGCTVYSDRPWACRMYPLDAGLFSASAQAPLYAVLEDRFCRGRDQGQSFTPQSYRDAQGLSERDALECGFHEIVTHPWFASGRHLDPRRIEMFHTACYNLDRFREFVLGSSFLKRFELADELIEKLRTDDLELLRFGFDWLRFALFGERTIALRDKK